MSAISTDERREVARRLRELPDDSTYPDLIGAIADHDGWYAAADAADRLADLIDPPYPDAMASYKGWRAEVYDPDGVLVSPSNVAADLVRAHADGKVPSEPKARCVAEVKVDGERLERLAHDAAVELTGIDRDALLALADELSGDTLDVPAVYGTCVGGYVAACRDVARRIREAMVVVDHDA